MVDPAPHGARPHLAEDRVMRPTDIRPGDIFHGATMGARYVIVAAAVEHPYTRTVTWNDGSVSTWGLGHTPPVGVFRRATTIPADEVRIGDQMRLIPGQLIKVTAVSLRPHHVAIYRGESLTPSLLPPDEPVTVYEMIQ